MSRPRPGAGPTFKIPIGVKFAVFITALVVVFMGVVTVSSVHFVQEAQESGVNRTGIQLVSLVTAALETDWLPGSEAASTAVEKPITRQERLKLIEDKLSRIMDETRGLDIINVIVRDQRGIPIATGLREARILVSREERPIESPAARETGVQILEWLYQGRPIRSFRRPIHVRDRGELKSVGQAEVLLSARQIEQARDTARREMITLSVWICALAAIGSFVLGGLFSIPIRALARDLRQVSLGNFDHRSRVRSLDELGDLARAFNNMTENLRQAQELMLARRATEHELQLANRIQERLLPSSTPEIPGFELATFYRPAREIGGDYFDFVRIDNAHIGMVVADVSGKGVPGSLVMTMTRSLLRLAAPGVTSASQTVRMVNRALSPDMNPGMFVTLVYFVLHAPSSKIELVRAGHNGPILFSHRTGKMLHLQPRGIAIGLDRTGTLFDSDLESRTFKLERGDFLVAFTDGIVEAKDTGGKDYSQERLARIVREHAAAHPRDMVQAVLDDVRAHSQRAEQSDDITMLVLKRSEK